jgi:hypothetical protein
MFSGWKISAAVIQPFDNYVEFGLIELSCPTKVVPTAYPVQCNDTHAQ